MSSPERVYVDTNVFVHHLFATPNDPKEGEFVRRTTMFFLDVEKQKYKAVTSTFTLTEYRGVMKRIISDRAGRIATHQEVEETVQKLEDFIRSEGIEVFGADDLIQVGYSPLFGDCDRIVEKASPIYTAKGHKSIAGADGLLTALADRCQAHYVATFDTGFKGLKWAVVPLILWDAYA